jgi:hypothetical protein
MGDQLEKDHTVPTLLSRIALNPVPANAYRSTPSLPNARFAATVYSCAHFSSSMPSRLEPLPFGLTDPRGPGGAR